MDKKNWFHPFASFLIKCRLRKEYQNRRWSGNKPDTLAIMGLESTAEKESRVNPWMGVFDDPALHESLDRILASNRIA